MVGAARSSHITNGQPDAAAVEMAILPRWQIARQVAVRALRLTGFPALAFLLIAAAVIVIVDDLAGPPGPVDLLAIAVILLAGLRQTVLVQERGRLLEGADQARRELE